MGLPRAWSTMRCRWDPTSGAGAGNQQRGAGQHRERPRSELAQNGRIQPTGGVRLTREGRLGRCPVPERRPGADLMESSADAPPETPFGRRPRVRTRPRPDGSVRIDTRSPAGRRDGLRAPPAAGPDSGALGTPAVGSADARRRHESRARGTRHPTHLVEQRQGRDRDVLPVEPRVVHGRPRHPQRGLLAARRPPADPRSRLHRGGRCRVLERGETRCARRRAVHPSRDPGHRGHAFAPAVPAVAPDLRGRLRRCRADRGTPGGPASSR